MNHGSRGMHPCHCRHTGPNHVGGGQQSMHGHGHSTHRTHWALMLQHTIGWRAVVEMVPAIATTNGSIDETWRKIVTGRGRVMACRRGWSVR